MSEPQEPVPEDHPPPYIIFVVVFFFFVTGLCGFLICHLLKQKGYSCHMKEDEVEEQDQLQGEDEDDDENQDTVEQILKCIIENEANMEAFNEMVGNRSVCVRHDPRLRKESIGGVPLHMHTVHSASDLHNTCHLCAQSRNKRSQRRGSRTPRLRARPGEQTVFSVGRFRVTHNDKKNLEGGGRVPDVLVGSGEGLNQSQDSYERRDGGYNLRNMFKDVRPPPDGGLAPNAGKRRRSLTLFGLRRGSDPTGVKVVSSGREGVKFIPQPIVLEEPQTETGENDGSKDDQSQKASDHVEVKMSGSEVIKTKPAKSTVVEFSARQGAKDVPDALGPSRNSTVSIAEVSAIKTQATNSIAVESLTQGMKDPASVLMSAPIPGPFKSPKPTETTEMDSQQEAPLSPGPLQTSTPISPLPKGEGINPFSNFSVDIPSAPTPPDPCTSPVPDMDSFESPVLISLGSSPRLSTRTSPLAITPSPIISAKASAQLLSSPKPSSSRPSNSDLSKGSLAKSALSLQSSSQSESLQDEASCQEPSYRVSDLSSSETKLEDSTSQQVEKPELSKLGILDDGKNSPSLSRSSSLGGRVGSVTIVKASPDSKREFSVVTMAEDQDVASTAAVEAEKEGGEEVRWKLGDDEEIRTGEEPAEEAKNVALKD